MDRHLFLPLPYDNRNMAINNEMMIDYSNGDVYISTARHNIHLGFDRVKKRNDDIITYIIDDMDLNEVNLNTISRTLDSIYRWKDILESDTKNDNVSTLFDIYSKLIGLKSNDSLNDLFNQKVDTDPFKGLSDNDFTDELYKILDSAEMFANNYVHPDEKQCIFYQSISTVNNKTGHVVLTKDELNIHRIHPEANKYAHPDVKICNANVVTSANYKGGEVILNKRDIGLSNIFNYKVSNRDDSIKKSDTTYLTNSNISTIMDEYVFEYYLNCRIGFDGTVVGVSLGQYGEGAESSPISIYNKRLIGRLDDSVEYDIFNKDTILTISPMNELNRHSLNSDDSISKIEYANLPKAFRLIVPSTTETVNCLYIDETDNGELYHFTGRKILKVANYVASACLYENEVIYVSKKGGVLVKNFDDIDNIGKRIPNMDNCIKAIRNKNYKAYLMNNGELLVDGTRFYDIKDIAINDDFLIMLYRTGKVETYPSIYNNLIKEKISSTNIISIDAKGKYSLLLTNNNIPIFIKTGGN